MLRLIRWLLHWFGQGMKLWLFWAVAFLCAVPIQLPLEFLRGVSKRFDTLGLPVQIGVVLGFIICAMAAVAIVAAVLEYQLRDNPLRPPAKKKDPPVSSSKKSQEID